MLLLALSAALLGLVLYFLFKARFDTGDVHPAYSSLRADPMGSMVLYESLERLPGVKVERDFSATNRLPDGKDTTYLQLAGRRWAWNTLSDDTVREVESFVVNGGRLVVLFEANSFQPIHEDEKKKTDEKAKKDKDKKKDTEKDATKKEVKPDDKKTKPRRIIEDDEDEDFKPVDLEKRWGFKLDNGIVKGDKEDKVNSGTARNVSGLALHPSIKWNNGGILKDLDPSWKSIYQSNGGSVMAEKTMGQGTIVFATDAFFSSNEAMPADRYAELLVWLIGRNHRIVFDEAHLGIVENPGLATLARKYRLHGLAVALLVLAGLFIWKNTMSLVPKRSEVDRELYVPGKDSAAGFAALLRRNVTPARLLAVCSEEWGKTLSRNARNSERDRQEVASILCEEDAKPKRARDPVATYRRITAALDPRARKSF
ncbi:hypothetical protein BH09VER1_BH09VER1_42830 [soil metagenome]